MWVSIFDFTVMLHVAIWQLKCALMVAVDTLIGKRKEEKDYPYVINKNNHYYQECKDQDLGVEPGF